MLNFASRNIDLLFRAFACMYVLLEYNSIIWSPFLKQDIEAIEKYSVDLLSDYLT